MFLSVYTRGSQMLTKIGFSAELVILCVELPDSTESNEFSYDDTG